jgi:hypothetical protein
MKLGILTSNFSTNNIDELRESKLASNRMRLNVAKDAAVMADIEVPPLDFYNFNINVDYLLIGKFVYKSGANIFIDDDGSRMKRWMQYIEALKRKNIKIFLDYTDHLIIAEDNRSDFYKSVLQYVDVVVTPSERMKENISKYFKGKIKIIEEPLEVDINPVKNSNFEEISALWFGHPTNLKYLFNYLINKKNINKLKIVTSQINEKEKIIIRNINKNIQIDFYNWEPNFYSKLNLECNICLIPSDTNDLKKNGVSNNRLITAYALGLLPIVTVVKSYEPYRSTLIDIDQINAFDKKNLMKLNNILKENQESIIEKYTTDIIKKKWLDLFKINK